MRLCSSACRIHRQVAWGYVAVLAFAVIATLRADNSDNIIDTRVVAAVIDNFAVNLFKGEDLAWKSPCFCASSDMTFRHVVLSGVYPTCHWM